ncbi:MAG: conjugative transfer protein MobI(A/C) [Aeromonas popoffii]|uniref:conjugative transfer protein MobI(A/C) n=1 Tax=Aeromonas popoffii TaxID=70856 RepID=UPI003F34195F
MKRNDLSYKYLYGKKGLCEMAVEGLASGVCGDIVGRLRQTLVEASEEVEALARQICDRYWLEFRHKNRSQRHLPAEDRLLGRYGPYVRRHPANMKLYIGWRDYAPTRKGPRSSKTLGVAINPSDGIHYRERQFSAKAKLWEMTLINKVERELRQLRELHEGIHVQLVRFKKAERIYEWETSNSPSEKKPLEQAVTTLQESKSEMEKINPLEGE